MAGSHLFGQCGQVAQKRFTETRKICYTGSHLFGQCGQVARQARGGVHHQLTHSSSVEPAG